MYNDLLAVKPYIGCPVSINYWYKWQLVITSALWDIFVDVLLDNLSVIVLVNMWASWLVNLIIIELIILMAT